MRVVLRACRIILGGGMGLCDGRLVDLSRGCCFLGRHVADLSTRLEMSCGGHGLGVEGWEKAGGGQRKEQED
jgi:hypothetical protein